MNINNNEINISELKKLANFNIKNLNENAKLKKLFSIFDNKNTAEQSITDGILSGSELNTIFDMFSQYAQFYGSLDTFDADDARYFVENAVLSNGKTLNDEGIGVNDVFDFLNRLIGNSNKIKQKIINDDNESSNDIVDKNDKRYVPSGIINTFKTLYPYTKLKFEYEPEVNSTNVIDAENNNIISTIENLEHEYLFDFKENDFCTVYYIYDKSNNNLASFKSVDYDNFIKTIKNYNKQGLKINENELKEYLKFDKNFAVKLLSDLSTHEEEWNTDENNDDDKYEGLNSIYFQLKFAHSENIIKEVLLSVINENGYSDLKRIINSDISYEDLLFIAEISDIRSLNNKKNNNIDEILYNQNVKQGSIGDCDFLSYLLSGTNNKNFLNLYTEHLIKIDKDNKTVLLKNNGIEHRYTFDDVNNSTEFSTGDMTVRVMEMAARDTMLRELSGCNGKNISDFLCGKPDLCKIYANDELKNNAKSIISHAKNKTHIMTTGLSCHNEKIIYALDSATGKRVKLEKNHAYAIVGANDRYIILKNPWNTKQNLNLKTETFINEFGCEEVELSELIKMIKIKNGIN